MRRTAWIANAPLRYQFTKIQWHDIQPDTLFLAFDLVTLTSPPMVLLTYDMLVGRLEIVKLRSRHRQEKTELESTSNWVAREQSCSVHN